MGTPRAFIVRHGETEWSLNGRHTGTTELPLTRNGERRIEATGKALVGNDRLIVPSKLAHMYDGPTAVLSINEVLDLHGSGNLYGLETLLNCPISYRYVSPRKRAQRTLELLHVGCKEKLPWQDERVYGDLDVRTSAKVQITEDIREWDYGNYEGLTSAQIREQRTKETGDGSWDIWKDGCPGGESPGDVTRRLDRLIADIRSRFHAAAIEAPKGSATPPDVLLVAHGHILRAFAMRWVGKRLEDNPSFILEAGGVGTLSYEHHRLDEPAILLGGAFVVVDIVEHVDEIGTKPE